MDAIFLRLGADLARYQTIMQDARDLSPFFCELFGDGMAFLNEYNPAFTTYRLAARWSRRRGRGRGSRDGPSRPASRSCHASAAQLPRLAPRSSSTWTYRSVQPSCSWKGDAILHQKARAGPRRNRNCPAQRVLQGGAPPLPVRWRDAQSRARSARLHFGGNLVGNMLRHTVIGPGPQTFPRAGDASSGLAESHSRCISICNSSRSLKVCMNQSRPRRNRSHISSVSAPGSLSIPQRANA